MLKKKVLSVLTPVCIISVLLIISCASTSREVYNDEIMHIPLKSSPQKAEVFLDGELKGVTPTIVIIRYLQSKDSLHESKTRKRILEIKKYGYEPYILSFSIHDKEYEKIINPVFLKKSEDAVSLEDLLVKEQQRRQEPKEAKVEESSNEITKPGEAPALLKEKAVTQKIKKNKNIIKGPSYNDDKNIYTTYTPISKLKVNAQDTPAKIYTIQTASLISIKDAQKQFNSISRLLNEKELDFLRIEKIGKYHAVRLGKFEDYTAAENLLKAIKSKFASAIILKAYIKNERIKMLYGDSLSDEKHRVKEKSLSNPVPDEIHR